MQLSIIILNYKVPYYLLNCLASVERAVAGIKAEVIVVDNHSQDKSIDLVQQHFPKIKTISLNQNLGFSKGNNIGVRQAIGKYICLLNPDTLVGEDTFKEFLAFAERQENPGALGPKLIDGSGRFLPESKRNIPTPKVAFQKLTGTPEKYYASISEDQNNPVEILVGAFMMMKKSDYWDVGGLDEDYFMYGEDIDLSFSLLKNSKQNYYLGKELVLHYKGESTVKNKRYRDLFYGAMQTFYHKHFHPNLLVKTVVKIGLSLAKKRHFQNKGHKSRIEKNKTIFYFGQKGEGLKKLQSKFPDIEQRGVAEISALPEKSMLIFDMKDFDYAQILRWIEQYKTLGFRFRVKPDKFDFIIGSDRNTARGQVLHI